MDLFRISIIDSLRAGNVRQMLKHDQVLALNACLSLLLLLSSLPVVPDMMVASALRWSIVNPGSSTLDPPSVVREASPVPGQAVQLPPPAGAAAGRPGPNISQLVGSHNLHNDKCDKQRFSRQSRLILA